MFEGTVSEINQNNVLVDYSNAVNRDKKGNTDAIGYLCSVEVTKDTVITDNNDKEITINDLKIYQMVKVILMNNKNIRAGMKIREVIAEKILTNGAKVVHAVAATVELTEQVYGTPS
ncbi:hypothetical protein [Sutcliffiella deserti]|uniref:hypothetical protein n=1 Tax=Sutcliffiella deserti TaxID=2875501 RepID=UPI001CBC6396|nr:hypothetical protein [Sutcliffiella deserti]